LTYVPAHLLLAPLFPCRTSCDGLPLNYQEACAAYYNSHYDAEVPEAYARKKAAHEVQQSLKRLRAAVTPSPTGSPAGTAC
jgi:hypothetical protein